MVLHLGQKQFWASLIDEPGADPSTVPTDFGGGREGKNKESGALRRAAPPALPPLLSLAPRARRQRSRRAGTERGPHRRRRIRGTLSPLPPLSRTPYIHPPSPSLHIGHHEPHLRPGAEGRAGRQPVLGGRRVRHSRPGVWPRSHRRPAGGQGEGSPRARAITERAELQQGGGVVLPAGPRAPAQMRAARATAGCPPWPPAAAPDARRSGEADDWFWAWSSPPG